MLKSKNKLKPERPALAALHEFRPKGREQWGMFLIGMAVACYFAFVILSKAFLMLPLSGGWPVYLLFPALAPAIYWLMCFLLRRIPEKIAKKKKESNAQPRLRRVNNLYPTVHSSRLKLSPGVFACAFFAVFAVAMAGLFAYYPGLAMVTDIRVQWEQVRTGIFDDWHPAIHTMLIWLVTRLYYSYGAFIAAQILFFSLLCGYFAATMRAWGFHNAWTALFVVAAVCAHKAMLYAYKDALFTCFAIWTAVCLVNIALSGGAWLGKWGNQAALAVALAFTSLMRINALAFTIPIVVLLCVFYAKKQTVGCVVSGALALLLFAGVKGPLYKMAGVTRIVQNQTYVFLTDSLVNIMGSIYLVAPGALDVDGVRLMHFLVGPTVRSDNILFGGGHQFLSLFPIYFDNYAQEFKERTDEYIAHCPPDKILPMTWHAVKNEPNLALKALVTASSLAWDPVAVMNAYKHDDLLIRDFIVRNKDNAAALAEITPTYIHPEFVAETIVASNSGFLRAFQTPYRVIYNILRCFPPGYLLQCIGLNILALVLCSWISLRRRRNWTASLVTLPVIAYNFGTMLIGSSDYRYFLFNVFITIPLALACLAKTKDIGKATAG